VPAVKVGFSPLDRRLKLVEHSWTPETIKAATRLGLEIASYRRAAESFQAVSRIPMSKSSLAELVNEYGGRLVEVQAREAEATVRAPERGEEIVWREMPEPDSEVMSVSLDGALINIRDEGWKEVKIATISAVEAEVQLERDEEKEVRLRHHSYRAGLWDAKQFAKQQWAEGCRRGLEKAKRIVSVNDGAAWIWLIIAMCYAPCIEIIDWWHAAEKLWEAANSLFGQGNPQAAAWVERAKFRLWTGQLLALMRQVRLACPRGEPLPEPVRAMVSYIFHNRRRMDYASYHQAGYPVGSGSVESACKVIVQQRLKQAGMRWSRERAQAVLALRCELLSRRWDEIWSPSILFPQLA
jgi:hypothetical protein